MSDPIALIQSILPDSGTAPANTASGASSSATGQAPTGSASTPDYTLSPSLSNLISQGSSLGLSGSSLANYNVQSLVSQNQSSLLSALPADTSGEAAFFNQLSLYQQYLTTARANTAGAAQAAAASPDPLASVLSDSHALANQGATSAGGTSSPASSSGLAAVDAGLARTVGYAQSLLDQ